MNCSKIFWFSPGIAMTAQRVPSNVFVRTLISGLSSCFSSDLRRFPKRGPNHMPLSRISCVRLMHLPSIHEPKSLLGDLSSFDPLFEPISLDSTNARLIKRSRLWSLRHHKISITVFTRNARPQAEQHSQDANGSCAANGIPGDDHLGHVVSRDSLTR